MCLFQLNVIPPVYTISVENTFPIASKQQCGMSPGTVTMACNSCSRPLQGNQINVEVYLKQSQFYIFRINSEKLIGKKIKLTLSLHNKNVFLIFFVMVKSMINSYINLFVMCVCGKKLQ